MGLPFRTSQTALITSQPFLHLKNGLSRRFSWPRFLRSLMLVVIFAIATFGYAPLSRAQATAPFNCDGTLYITNAATDQDATNLDFLNTSGDFGIEDVPNQSAATVTYNAAGFRPQDGFIYGIRPNNRGLPTPAASTEPRSTVYRVDSTGAVTSLGVPPGITNADYFAGDIGPSGTLYVYAPVQITPGSAPSGLLTEINVTTTPPSVIRTLTVERTDNSAVPELFDVAFNPEDGQLYGFDRAEGDIVRLDVNNPVGGVVSATPLAATGTAPGTEIVGGTFFDAFGRIFLYANSGSLYRGQVEPGLNFVQFELLSNPPGVGNNDGASCPYAPLVEKVASSAVVEAGDTVTYTYSFTNSNFVDLQNVTFTDVLLTNGAADGRTFVPGSLQSVSGGILNGTTTNNYGVGANANNLVINGITLSPGTTGSFSVDVLIAADTPPGTLENQAVIETTTATIIPPGGGPPSPINPRIVARTDNPQTPDNFPDPTPIDTTPSSAGVIGIAKRAGTLTINNNGTIDIPYVLVVENLGPVAVNNLQIFEDLVDTFQSPATFTILSGPGSNDGLTTNPSFTGLAPNIQLLQGANSLAVGQSASVFFTVRVTPNGNYGPYENIATVTGTDPSGNQVTDQSNDGEDPDPNNNGNPGDPNEDTPTTVIPRIADLAVEKGVDNPNPNIGDTITYTITLRNLGPSATTNVTVQENLPAGFTATAPANTAYNAATGVWSIPAVGEPGSIDPPDVFVLTAEGTYDGTPFENVAEITGTSVPDPNPNNDISRVQVPSVTADLSLEKTLVDTSAIAVGNIITFEIELTNSGPDTATNIQIADDFPEGFDFVAARPETGTYNDTTNIWSIVSLASGQSTSLLLSGRLRTDSITNVAEVSAVDQGDPDSTPNNRNPDEDDYGRITVSISPELVLQKRITALIQDGNVTRFTQPTANPVRPEFVGQVSLPASTQVTSQDIVEYTIYYLASGTTANDVDVCDAIPAGTSYVASTLSAASGTANPSSLTDANDGDGGQFLPELTPAPSPCSNGMNPNGSVLFSVGDVPAGQSGFVRFRSRVN